MSIITKLKNIFFQSYPQPTPQDQVVVNRMLNLIDLEPGDIAIDCGANVGNITASIAETGAVVYAFEPNPYAFRVLNKRFTHNKNIHCYNKGVHDHNGKMRLYMHKNAKLDQVYWSTGSSLLEYKGNVSRDTYIEVEVVDLVKFIQNLERDVKLIKMDVEGVECPIINKMIDVGVINKIGMMLVETHDEKVPQLRTETEALRQRVKQLGLMNINLNWI